MYGGYRAVFSTIWTGDTGQEWNRLGHQYHKVAFYLLTGPLANAYGLYYLPLVIMQEHTGLTGNALVKMFEVYDREEFAHYDTSTQWVWVRNMVRYQLFNTGGSVSPGDKRLFGVRRFYDSCPLNAHLGPFYDLYGAALGLANRRERARTVPAESAAYKEPVVAAGVTEKVQDGDETPVSLIAIVPKRFSKAEFFELWWKHYPKKVGKKAALAEWMKLEGVDDGFTARAIATLEWQHRQPEWVKENGQFIPDPERYIKRGRFSDEPRDAVGITDRDVRTANVLSEWASGGEL
jgi:hypothetical protein